MRRPSKSPKSAPGKGDKAMQEEKEGMTETEQLYLSYRIMSSLANSTGITRQLFLEEKNVRVNNLCQKLRHYVSILLFGFMVTKIKPKITFLHQQSFFFKHTVLCLTDGK